VGPAWPAQVTVACAGQSRDRGLEIIGALRLLAEQACDSPHRPRACRYKTGEFSVAVPLTGARPIRVA
jgi:hypothetical protein